MHDKKSHYNDAAYVAPRNSTSTRCKSMKIQIGYFLPKSKHGLGQNLPLDGGAEQKVERWSDPALAADITKTFADRRGKFQLLAL